MASKETKQPPMTAALAEEVRGRSRLLYSAEQVETALDSMAIAIAKDLSNSNPIMLSVMTGAFITSSELALRLKFPLEVDYVHASRYGDATRGGELEWHREPALSLKGRTVLLVDDIFDQGATIAGIADYCEKQGAKQVRVAVLVDKKHDRKLTELRPDYVGLSIEDYYIFGYGMDYRGYLRNSAGIYAVDDADY